LGGHKDGQQQWIVLEDLDLHYPERKADVTLQEMQACLRWLAHFHAAFLQAEPKGLWPIGSYWHLATRPDELERMQHPTLKAKAAEIDHKLNKARFQTIIHGDAKLANFCFSEDGTQVAAVDFQYVGGGVGIKDVAYFLGSCFACDELFSIEEEALNLYFKALRLALEQSEKPIDLTVLEQEWRSLYSYAIADFTRFLLGWMPEHQKVNAYHLQHTEEVLTQL
jgi:thiamine kinase-like enzyme